MPKKAPREFKSEVHKTCFECFWAGFWLKKAKKDAQNAYIEKVTTTGMHRKVMQAVQEQTPEMLLRAPNMRPYAATWLRAERWEDEAIPVAGTRTAPSIEQQMATYEAWRMQQEPQFRPAPLTEAERQQLLRKNAGSTGRMLSVAELIGGGK